MLLEKGLDCLYNANHIPRDTFQIHASSSNVHTDDHILVEDTVIVYKEQMKAGLRFPIDPFYTDVLNFHKLSIAQIHPKNWRFLMAI